MKPSSPTGPDSYRDWRRWVEPLKPLKPLECRRLRLYNPDINRLSLHPDTRLRRIVWTYETFIAYRSR